MTVASAPPFFCTVLAYYSYPYPLGVVYYANSTTLLEPARTPWLSTPRDALTSPLTSPRPPTPSSPKPTASAGHSAR